MKLYRQDEMSNCMAVSLQLLEQPQHETMELKWEGKNDSSSQKAINQILVPHLQTLELLNLFKKKSLVTC